MASSIMMNDNEAAAMAVGADVKGDIITETTGSTCNSTASRQRDLLVASTNAKGDIVARQRDLLAASTNAKDDILARQRDLLVAAEFPEAATFTNNFNAEEEETMPDDNHSSGGNNLHAVIPWEDFAGDVQALPTSLERRDGRSDVAVPGAHSVGGGFFRPRRQDNNNNNNNNDDTNGGALLEETAVLENNNGNSLPVAHPVAEEDPAQLPQAQEEQKQSKKNGLLVVLPVLVFFIFSIILVAVLVWRDDDYDEIVLTPTGAPTSHSQAPTTIEGSILSLFPEETVRVIQDESADSPQSKAFQWLVQDEQLGLYSAERIKQRFALTTLYFATNGHEWTMKDHWLNYTVHECDWYNSPEFALKSAYEIAFEGYLSKWPPPGLPYPTTCRNDSSVDGDRYYKHLWLDHNNLVGTLPLEVYWMTSLESLSFAINELEGSISSHLGKLTKLQALAYSRLESQEEAAGNNVQVVGTLPTEIGLLTGLSILLIQHLHVSVPPEVWQLTKLDTLISEGNFLQGTIPTEIGNVHKLRWLSVRKSNVSGTLPTELGQLDNLELLVFSENRLINGTIPIELGKLTQLGLLSLYEMSLGGSLPTELGLLTASTLISIRDNSLSGTLPSELGLLTDLELTLNLRNNRFLSGPIPTELGLFPALRELSISGNQITGHIPSELGQLTSMGQLSLGNNSLSGTIPQELTAMQQTLHSLYLEGNPMLSGIFPEGLCNPNATCVTHVLDPCEPPYGLSFYCTSLLCGCGCSMCN